MADSSLPMRWIACVDGTWCNPDGPHGLTGNRQYNNISNTYRICASIKVGTCVDQNSGNTINQQKKYYNGLASESDLSLFKKLYAGAFGTGFNNKIGEVYEDCCKLPEHPQNEIWLFGFSRGAYVVLAVAGLLHHFQALKSAGTPAFAKDFERVLQLCPPSQRQMGERHEFLASSTRKAPKINFIGVLDTVKALDDKSLYDISFNNSIQHLRHALALNECRRTFEPEYFFPDLHNLGVGRSFVQAWFLGVHINIGGSAAKDGLGLYPLQWMLTESKGKGLVLEFDRSFDERAKIDDPLELVFPSSDDLGKGVDMSSFQIKNNLNVHMQDLRKVHKLSRYGERYAIHLSRSKLGETKPRTLFDPDGNLKGYCNYAPQGTILHPSVYLIFDEYTNVFLNSRVLPSRDKIEELRGTILTQEGFWNDRNIVSIEGPEAFRILVCGNTGIGKSTLINEVFGAELAAASERSAGIHNIKHPITSPDRPDLILHDSGGFEAGGQQELQQVVEFLADMCNATDIRDRLHVIWFCVEISSTRTQQKVTKDFFSALARNSAIPIVVVGTKKDVYWNTKFGESRKKFARLADLEAHADAELDKRMREIEDEVDSITDGRCDAIVAVSKDDKRSIQTLTDETAKCFDHEKLRALYVAVQVASLDLKVDSATNGTMRIFKQAIKSTTYMLSRAIYGITSAPSARVDVCEAVVHSFGIPSVTPTTVQKIVSSLIWGNLDLGFGVYFTETNLSLSPPTGLTVMIGGITYAYIPPPLGNLLIVPSLANLILTIACDLTLILLRAFQKCTHQCLGPPLIKDIKEAAYAYRGLSKEVHKSIKDLVPMSNFLESFRFGKIKIGYSGILQKYVKDFVES